MMERLLVASSNKGKLRDFSTAAAAHGIVVEPVPGLTGIPAPPEDEPTFAGNARAKAVYYSRFAPGELVVADDSGLEVEALGGEPGVRSARYADDAGLAGAEDGAAIDRRNNDWLLERLAGVEAPRVARYVCVLAAARDGECLLLAEGAVEGEILAAARGSGGFGYDPLFYLTGLGKTMAEVDLETKHTLSHRGRAFRALLNQLG